MNTITVNGTTYHAHDTRDLHPLQIGQKVFIRTVTFHYLGRVAQVVHGFVILEDASWVACAPRLSEFLTTGQQDEVEPYADPVAVRLDTIVDATLWRHDLPTEAK
jgi:hypothetical protein